MTFSGWTPENTYHLISRWNDGASLGTIAKELGHTRNALIGKVKRLGLRPSGSEVRLSAPAREGQGQFRRTVVSAYGGRCCVTGCAQSEILQAAHIVPYSMTRDHTVRNGLCLRIDLHGLFDCGLIGVDPSSRVVISHHMKDVEYVSLHGQAIQLPEDPRNAPDPRLVAWHLEKVFRA